MGKNVWGWGGEDLTFLVMTVLCIPRHSLLPSFIPSELTCITGDHSTLQVVETQRSLHPNATRAAPHADSPWVITAPMIKMENVPVSGYALASPVLLWSYMIKIKWWFYWWFSNTHVYFSLYSRWQKRVAHYCKIPRKYYPPWKIHERYRYWCGCILKTKWWEGEKRKVSCNKKEKNAKKDIK